MRILYFTRDYTTHDHRFLAALAETEHQVLMLRLERRGPQLEDRALPPGIEQLRWRGGQHPARRQDGPALWLDLQRVLRQVRPDVVHAGPIQTSAFLTALSGFRPLVSMSWGSDLLRDAQRDEWWRWASRFTLSRTSVLVADCQAVCDAAARLGFPAERTVAFPWGVDLQVFSPPAPEVGRAGEQLRERLGWQNAFVLLCLRAWEPIYGVDIVVRAFIQAAQQLPELRLFLLGTGSQAPMIQRLLADAGMNDRVHLGGQVSQANLPKYYRAADLYINASHSDGSSISLLEALACGLPALVSDIPGNREWISEGQAGWLFPDADVSQLAEKIVQAAQQRSQLGAVGMQARRLAEARADWRQNFPQLLKAYALAKG